MAATSKTPLSQLQASTDGPNMASPNPYQAAHAVFGTNELLYGIIVQLPLKDIVAATGVCQTWRKALKDNVAIQQALFITPVEVSDIFSEVDCLSMTLEDIPHDQYRIVGKLHSHTVEVWEARVPAGGEDAIEDSSSEPMIKHPFGVWQDMFITQPPCTTATVYLAPHLGWFSRSETFVLKCETGVKMGELHDFCTSLLQSHPKATGATVHPDEFIQEAHADNHKGGRWEVRDGKVVRQTGLRWVERPDSETSSDDQSGDSDGEHEDEYDTDEMEEERNEARYAQAYNHDYRGDYDDGNDEWDYGDDDDEES